MRTEAGEVGELNEGSASMLSNAANRNRPRHFHLLWDHELVELRPILALLNEHLDAVVAYWYRLYELHFGDERTLPEREFFDLYHTNLGRNTRDLIEGDVDRYASDTIRTGEALAARGVPFSEVVASLHLYEESAYKFFPDPRPPVETYTSFDKLSHIRMILLANAYFRAQTAVIGVRVNALEREVSRLSPRERESFHGMIGGSPAMHELYDRIEAVAETLGTVMIVGESGTGKELIARAIHDASGRRSETFVALNCAALPKDLIESELFGYKRGAFSGANLEYIGIFRSAEGGTLFLDEITEMSPDTQSKLLRALQERSVRPVGSTREVPINVRVIASTNRDPEEAVRARQLREDLYYRLQANTLVAPPLRERKADIPLLVEHFIELFNERTLPKIRVQGIELDALETMRHFDWPGNVRQLANAVEGAITFGRRATIRSADLPPALRGARPVAAPKLEPAAPVAMGTFADAEREIISRALTSTGGNKAAAASLLRISRKKLYAKITKFGLG
jgi:transcriptional regulator with PAS, ATPase and Fis domain